MKGLSILLCLVLMSCGIKEELAKDDVVSAQTETTSDLPAHFILDEVIVKLDEDIGPREFEDQMQDIGLSHKDDIAAISRLYLFTYDQDKISHNLVLDKLRAHPQVLQVEFNKRLELRD